ncbi:hypothetical protein D3C72_1916300 [compost metagenome]
MTSSTAARVSSDFNSSRSAKAFVISVSSSKVVGMRLSVSVGAGDATRRVGAIIPDSAIERASAGR